MTDAQGPEINRTPPGGEKRGGLKGLLLNAAMKLAGRGSRHRESAPETGSVAARDDAVPERGSETPNINDMFASLPDEMKERFRAEARGRDPRELAQYAAEQGVPQDQLAGMLGQFYSEDQVRSALQGYVAETPTGEDGVEPAPVEPFESEGDLNNLAELDVEARTLLQDTSLPPEEAEKKKLEWLKKFGQKFGEQIHPKTILRRLFKTTVVGGGIFAVILLFFFLMHAPRK